MNKKKVVSSILSSSLESQFTWIKKEKSANSALKQLVEHYDEFTIDMEWDSSYLLHLGMDGPNANPTIKNFLTRFIHSSKREFSNCKSISITSLSICMVFSNCIVPDVKIIIT